MSTKQHQLLEIVWQDASGADGWIEASRLINSSTIITIHTVGYLVKEDTESITLTMALNPEGSQYGAFMHIPKVNVKKRKKLA